MNRQEKEKVIQSLTQDFSNNPTVFVIGLNKIALPQLEKLRREVGKQGGKLRVAKNTLFRRAIANEELLPFFNEERAVVFVKENPTEIAKTLETAAQAVENFLIVGGLVDNRVINREMVKFFATLPPRDMLVAQTCGMLKAPITKHVGLLNQLIVRFVYVIKQASEKQQSL